MSKPLTKKKVNEAKVAMWVIYAIGFLVVVLTLIFGFNETGVTNMQLLGFLIGFILITTGAIGYTKVKVNYLEQELEKLTAKGEK